LASAIFEFDAQVGKDDVANLARAMPHARSDHVPVIIFVHGSGRLDRDGNGAGLHCDSYRLLALALAEHGVASYRYDKRGAGKSHPDLPPEKRTLDRFVDDVVAVTEQVRRDPRVGRVTLLGHSEGSNVVLLAANRAKPDALILAGGPGRPLVEVLRAQLESQIDAATLVSFERLVSEVRLGHALDGVPKDLEPLFRPSALPWLRSSLDEDPTNAAHGVRLPVVIVRGEFDAQVGKDDVANLARAMPHARSVEVPRANHVFKEESSIALPQPSYSDPSKPIARGTVEAFLSGVAR
jgi:pimeloyl-ACP methyl ester carboxylesterase